MLSRPLLVLLLSMPPSLPLDRNFHFAVAVTNALFPMQLPNSLLIAEAVTIAAVADKTLKRDAVAAAFTVS